MRKTRSKWTLSKVAPFKAKFAHLKAVLKANQVALANHESSKYKDDDEEMVKVKWLGLYNDFKSAIAKAEAQLENFKNSIAFPLTKLV